jgi:ankyrin repeat protein
MMGKITIHEAAREGLMEELVRLIEQEGVDVNLRNDYGVTALDNATSAGQIEAVRFLLKSGANPNGSQYIDPNYQTTALHLAAERDFYECAQLLIEYGADLESRDFHGDTPLLNALTTDGHSGVGSERVAVLLLEKGCDPNASGHDSAPLGLALVPDSNVREKLSRSLVEHGANANVPDQRFGRTPLHWAVQCRDLRLINLFMAHGGDPKIRSNDGKTPLDLALEMKYNEEIIANLRSESK